MLRQIQEWRGKESKEEREDAHWLNVFWMSYGLYIQHERLKTLPEVFQIKRRDISEHTCARALQIMRAGMCGVTEYKMQYN